jgi:hypothetical protein
MHPPFQWPSGTLFRETRRPGRESDNSHPSSAEVKKSWGLYVGSSITLHAILLNYKGIGDILTFRFITFLTTGETGRIPSCGCVVLCMSLDQEIS